MAVHYLFHQFCMQAMDGDVCILMSVLKSLEKLRCREDAPGAIVEKSTDALHLAVFIMYVNCVYYICQICCFSAT